MITAYWLIAQALVGRPGARRCLLEELLFLRLPLILFKRLGQARQRHRTRQLAPFKSLPVLLKADARRLPGSIEMQRPPAAPQ